MCKTHGSRLGPGWVLLVVLLSVWLPGAAMAQTQQQGADAKARGADRLRFDYVGYRPARYETEFLHEPQNERPNRGGLIYAYFTNTSDKPIRLAFWRANGHDESYWRLGGFLAWDRVYGKVLDPGELGLLEIDAVSEDFAEGEPFSFAYIGRPSWSPVGSVETELRVNPIQITYIRVLPGLGELEVHVRNRGQEKVTLESLEIVGHVVKAVSWVGQTMDGPSRAIARLELEQPLASAGLLVAKLAVKNGQDTRPVYAHRRAFADWFPIGCWSNKPDTYALLRRLHIDTCVHGGRAEDEFYSGIAPKYGFRTMVPSGGPDVDQLRSLGDHPAVACWMLADEPDWGTAPNIMLFVDRIVRRYNHTKPTFITLCRNVKFFEYAPICDIPCMDHYCVTAPTSSKWPKFYGTHLEETAYYTRDLKYASEPKPIWVWSQAIATWSERPKRPVPTPNELAAQLVLNLGRGAKGIIWFNYEHNVAQRYPDVRQAMQRWGRVLRLTRDDFLAAEPIETSVKTPEKVDVAPLASWDKLLLCVTNLDYEIHDQAYPFTTHKDVQVSMTLPEWIDPAVALEVAPDGVSRVPFNVKRGRVEVELGDLEVAKVIVLANDPAAASTYGRVYERVLQEEHREF